MAPPPLPSLLNMNFGCIPTSCASQSIITCNTQAHAFGSSACKVTACACPETVCMSPTGRARRDAACMRAHADWHSLHARACRQVSTYANTQHVHNWPMSLCAMHGLTISSSVLTGLAAQLKPIMFVALISISASIPARAMQTPPHMPAFQLTTRKVDIGLSTCAKPPVSRMPAFQLTTRRSG